MSADEDSDPRAGSIIDGRYAVQQRLAAGAMGVVYRGEHTELRRAVAIKFLHPMFASEPSFAERFQREALTMSKLDHPNCVSVVDMGIDDAPYIVMDYVRGTSLEDLLDDGPLPPKRAINIVCQVLAGLAHAHERGIIHRDIKPANAMLAEVTGAGDHVRILDFGLAKFKEAANQTMTGVVVGTPSYMAPEQAAGGKLDARSDIYSTGIMLFHLLTGEKPFSGDTYQLIRKHIEEPPPRLRDVGGDLVFSRELEELVARALAKAPDERPQSAPEFAGALRALPEMTGAEIVPAPATRPAPPPIPQAPSAAPPRAVSSPPRRKRGWLIAFALLGLTAVVVMLTPFGRGLFRETRQRAGHALGGLLNEPDGGAPAPKILSIEDARAAAAAGRIDDAIRGLHDLRRARPDDGAISKTLGDLYFDKRWAAEGLAAYREAITKATVLRTDPQLIDNTLRSLADPETADLASNVIVGHIGDAALPALRRAAEGGDPSTRERATHLLQVLSRR